MHQFPSADTIFSDSSSAETSCDLIVIGHLKWNPYFGEQADQPPRGDPSTCTSVLIRGLDRQGQPYALLVDPTLRHSAADYYFDLNRRTGLSPQAITHCFVTHEHMDHQAGLAYFPDARWLAAEPVAAALRSSPYIDGLAITSVRGEFLPGIRLLALPGHTASLHGLALLQNGQRTVIAADAVMTRDHFREQTCMFEQDKEQAAATIQWLRRHVEIIIPGHDNIIMNQWTES